MKTLSKIYCYSFSLLFLSVAASADAQITNPAPLPNPLSNAGVSTVPDLLNLIVKYFTEISAPIITIMVLVGAFKMLTSAGNESKFADGKKTVTYAVIGAAVVLLAQGVSYIVSSFINGQ